MSNFAEDCTCDFCYSRSMKNCRGSPVKPGGSFFRGKDGEIWEERKILMIFLEGVMEK